MTLPPAKSRHPMCVLRHSRQGLSLARWLQSCGTRSAVETACQDRCFSANLLVQSASALSTCRGTFGVIRSSPAPRCARLRAGCATKMKPMSCGLAAPAWRLARSPAGGVATPVADPLPKRSHKPLRTPWPTWRRRTGGSQPPLGWPRSGWMTRADGTSSSNSERVVRRSMPTAVAPWLIRCL